MNNIIKLDINKKLSVLSGNEFGSMVYEKNVKKYIENGGEYLIKFPDNIEVVSISFVKGFFSNLIEEKNIDYIKKHFSIETKNKELTKSIWESLDF